MIDIEGRIVSIDILTEHFCCDVSLCKGECCVDGNSGAPLDEDELDIIEQQYPLFSKYMVPAGIEAVERQGFFVVDSDGDYTTPLVDDAECAYAYVENGITLCAMEKAYRKDESTFMKPISCHLYPIRVTTFGDGTQGLNYHRWSVCASARRRGAEKGIPVYRTLKEPIVRRFGDEFYDALDAAAAYVADKK